MKVAVLGASGFIGRHLVKSLVERGHEVIAVARSTRSFQTTPWINDVQIVKADLYADFNAVEIAQNADVVIDLVWPGLPNYGDMFHFERNLPKSFQMLKKFVTAGYQRILVAGTCFEYGMQSGPLSSACVPHPHTAYGFAKDALRQSLEQLQQKMRFTLQWARLFYIYGDGQSESSLIPQLDQAIGRGDVTFPMSGGEQLRDFISVQDAVRQLCRLMENPQLSGCFNVCSGKPTSVRRFVEQHILMRKSSIELELGRFPYPTYEPMAFWGHPHIDLMDDGTGMES